MAHDNWQERLEAYLDGELDAGARSAFEAEATRDPALSKELSERRTFRERTRSALRGGLPEKLVNLRDLEEGRAARTKDSTAKHTTGRILSIPTSRLRPLLALAAVLLLAILAPQLLRNRHGAEGPRSSITIDGPVTALGYGETPHQTTRLEAGCFDLAAGACR